MVRPSDFLYPYSRYRGSVNPENVVFNSNLQEFSQRVSLICGLQTNGKLSPEEAFRQIELLWEQLQHSQEELGIGKNPFQLQKD
ncbi:MAG: hypothetical protein IGS50_06420 [Synechococcales cyanobacterium C42_A2020_086]|jgi:hypothetical protein|nr:hypothetical protein [Synechococcales cyanobacterium M58_A2018_015]MBF2073382.1 hypothetical protein [Synechococcales cyanobacterium C42_A2020_086]